MFFGNCEFAVVDLYMFCLFVTDLELSLICSSEISGYELYSSIL